MIPFTCPCCEVSHPPHRDGCDFHNDCPTDAEVFDEVSALRSEVARLREERRWIPVTERLPDGNEWVDVAGPWGDSVGWYEPSGWRNVDDDPWPCEVTHWRKRGPGPGVEVE